MAKIITVQGHNVQDEDNRAKALEILNDQDTVVLERLSKCCQNDKAVNYFKNSILFKMVESFLAK